MNKAVPKNHIVAAAIAPQPQDRFAQLVDRLTHDLRAPVRAMVELTRWIEEEIDDTDHPKSQDLVTYMGLLKLRGARLEDLMSNLAMLGQVGQDTTCFDGDWSAILDPAARQVLHLKNFDLITNLCCAPQIAQADLLTLVTALLSNAGKHHHQGHGQITLVARPQQGGCVVIVEDDGPGIAPADRVRVVDMFATLSAQDAVEGSGLGLAIVKQITDHYGGHLTIDTPASGQGCRVTAWFPQARAG